MRSVHGIVVLPEELSAFLLGQVPENNLRVVRILDLDRLDGHAIKPTPGPGRWPPSLRLAGVACDYADESPASPLPHMPEAISREQGWHAICIVIRVTQKLFASRRSAPR